jgi:DNA invertase Pin-like site-specific DNA recombinase
MEINRKIGYILIYDYEINEPNQLKNLTLDKIFIEKETHKISSSREIYKLFEYVKSGDIVFVESFARFAKNISTLQSQINKLITNNVSVKFLKEDLLFSKGNAENNENFFQVMNVFVGFEKEISRKKQLANVLNN